MRQTKGKDAEDDVNIFEIMKCKTIDKEGRDKEITCLCSLRYRYVLTL